MSHHHDDLGSSYFSEKQNKKKTDTKTKQNIL